MNIFQEVINRNNHLFLQMAETQPEATKSNEAVDTGLPAVTASLEMLSVNTNISPSKDNTVFERLSVEANETLNRRCSLRPRKRRCEEMESNDKKKCTQAHKEVDVKDYYLNRNLKRKLSSLETIFEEKDDKNESTTYMSVKRYKRMIKFNDKCSDSKLKKRKARIKRVFGSKINFKRKCASMQMLIDKLNSARAESPEKIENKPK